jgi:hypothetical protein
MLLYTVSDLTTWEDLDADVSTTLKQISGQDQMADSFEHCHGPYEV